MAFAVCYGRYSRVEDSVGHILDNFTEYGLPNRTTGVYTSDHGDNVGASGVWESSPCTQECVAVHLIRAWLGIPAWEFRTPAGRIDLAVTRPDHFGLEFAPGDRSLFDFVDDPPETDQVALSEHHAAGAVSGAFMNCRGQRKYDDFAECSRQNSSTSKRNPMRSSTSGLTRHIRMYTPGFTSALSESVIPTKSISRPLPNRRI